MKEKTISSVKMYSCSFLELYEDDIITSKQKESKRVFIKHPGGAAVLPITKEGQIILTKQFRYPIREVTIELPAGKKDYFNEDPLICAKRELEEETGLVSNQMEFMYDLHPCLGYSDEILSIYIAYQCEKKENPLPMDEDENIELIVLEPNEVSDLLKSGKITDGKTIIALQYYLIHLMRIHQ